MSKRSKPFVIDQLNNFSSEPVDEFCLRWQPTAATLSAIDLCPYEEACRVAKSIRAIPSQCYFNARKAILKLPEYADAIYVEGWANCGFPIEHGWIVKDGLIVDPTLGRDARCDKYQYFAGLEFHGRSAIEEFLRTKRGRKCKQSPFFFAFGWGGYDSPGFRRAWESVKAAAFAGAAGDTSKFAASVGLPTSGEADRCVS